MAHLHRAVNQLSLLLQVVMQALIHPVNQQMAYGVKQIRIPGIVLVIEHLIESGIVFQPPVKMLYRYKKHL